MCSHRLRARFRHLLKVTEFRLTGRRAVRGKDESIRGLADKSRLTWARCVRSMSGAFIPARLRRFAWHFLLVAGLTGSQTASAQEFVDPDYLHAWQLAGEGNANDAIRLLRTIIERNTEQGLAFAPAYELLARTSHLAKRDAEGEAYFRDLAARNPKDSLPHWGLVTTLSLEGKRQESNKEMWVCAESRPPVAECYRGVAWSAAGDAAEGVTEKKLLARIGLQESQAESQLALARFRIRREEFDLARQAGERAVSAAQLQSDIHLLVAAHRLLSELASARGNNPTEELRQAEEACRISRRGLDPTAIFDSCRSVGAGLLDSGEPLKAVTYLTGLVREAREIKNPLEEGTTEKIIALYLGAQGDTAGALQHADRAVALCRDSRHWGELWGTEQAIGALEMAAGDYDRAMAVFEEAVEVARTDGNPTLEAYALSKLTVACNRAGNNLASIRTAEEAIRIFRSQGMNWQAEAEVGDVAAAYLSLGDYATAVSYIRESKASARRFLDPREEMRTGNLLGEALLELGRTAEAAETLKEALALAPRTPGELFEVKTRTLLGEAYSRLQKGAKAEAEFTRAQQLAGKAHDVWLEADALCRLGQHYLRSAQYAQAEDAFTRCLKISEPGSLVIPAEEARYGLSEIALSRNDLRGALGHLEIAVQHIESVRAAAPGPDLRAGLLERNWRVYEDLLNTLLRLHEEEPNGGFDLKALTYVERSHARVLLDLLSESKESTRIGLTAEQEQRQAELDRELDHALADLRASNSVAHRAAADRAERAIKKWTVELHATNPRYQELKYPQPMDAAGIQQLAAATGTLILEYSVGTQRSRVWAATGQRVRSAALPPEAVLSKLVQRLRTAINTRPDSGNVDDFRRPAKQLFHYLLEPVQEELANNSRVVIIADGILHYLPFECLIDKDGRFVIDQASISYAPSASVFASLESASRSKAHQEILALGDPVFPKFGVPSSRRSSWSKAADRDLQVVRGVYSSSGFRLEDLPGSEREVKQIAALFPPNLERVLLGRAATVRAFRAERLDDFRLMHLATHALIDERSPMRSGIVLSVDVQRRSQDVRYWDGRGMGVLQLSEIMRLKLDADLVTLSACNTGLGRLVRGEGMVGLTRAFFFAGARRLAVSLWPVNDESTPDFMKTFYQHLRSGASPTDALRAAKLEMLHSKTRCYKHPYFWAAFVLTGAR